MKASDVHEILTQVRQILRTLRKLESQLATRRRKLQKWEDLAEENRSLDEIRKTAPQEQQD